MECKNSIMATFFALNNRDKGNTYIEALLDAGYTLKEDYDVDFLLIDYERSKKREEIVNFIKKKKPVFIYPHSAISDILWDGMYDPLPVTCNFVSGVGQKKVMQSYGYKYPIEVCGWPYSELERFKSTTGKKLLFAPIHPNSAGKKLLGEDKKSNYKTLKYILDNKRLFSSITLRYGGDLIDNGLDEFKNSGIIMEKADYSIENSIKSIKRTDLVVSFGTFGYLSVALGKPTIFYAQDVVPHNICHSVKSFRKYSNIRNFPIELFDKKFYGNMPYIKKLACEKNKSVEDWKKLFIGDPFNAEKFINIVKLNLGEK